MNLIGIVGLLAQVEAAPINEEQSLLQLMMNANAVMQLTLLLLVIFSIISWAIIGSKYRQLKLAKRRSVKFFSRFLIAAICPVAPAAIKLKTVSPRL